MASAIKLIAGLGNPGADYAQTRHNVGFWLAEQIAAQFHSHFSVDKKLFAELARVQSSGGDFRLMKPQTYMNESGRAVQAVADYYSIDSDEILIMHDEIDLPAGVIKLKQAGGHGGNNGLRSISQCLADKNYYRLRIGVGHPGSKERVTGHVLGRPDKQDRQLIETALQRALDSLDLIVKGEMNKAMNVLHTDNTS